MGRMEWAGVLPAITTPFAEDGSVDLGFLEEHGAWMLEAGCRGLVALGSLGEGATLEPAEKHGVLEACLRAAGGRFPVVSAISALSTREAVRLAREAAKLGCSGLMVLPPYVHKGPWDEIRAHFSAVLEATELSCMLYNNPIAYGVDLVPEQIEELASSHPNLHAVKESSGDCRRLSAVRALLGDRLALFAGLDDMVYEAALAGAQGWIAGLVNALPSESVRLFELARAGQREDAFDLHRWFLPLLKLDTVPEFVQLIKLVQAEYGKGSERVRLPRLPVSGDMREETLRIIRHAKETAETS